MRSSIVPARSWTLRDPRSREYAVQTIRSLKRYLEDKYAQGVDLELQRIIEYKHWEVGGFENLDAYLKAEVGGTHKELHARLKPFSALDRIINLLSKLTSNEREMLRQMLGSE